MPIITKDDPSDNPSGALIGVNNLLVSADGSIVPKSLTPNTYERWDDASGTMTGVFQLSSATRINYVGIAGHNLFSAGTTEIEIRVSSTIGGGKTTINTLTPVSDAPLMIEIDEDDVGEITIFMPDGTDREIAVVYAGVSLQMPRNIYGGHSPIALSQKTEYQAVKSESGQILGKTIIRKGLETAFSWRLLDDQFYRDEFQPFVEAARTTPFFIKWRPEFYSDEVAFGEVNQDIKPINSGGGIRLMSVGFTMTAHADL